MFGIFGKGSIISVHDNLDLFVAQFQMLKNTGAFWKHGVEVPFLGGISRDVLPSEFSLYSLLYMILPSYYAYVAGYLLKIVIGTFSMVLLARDLFKDQYGESKPVIFLAGFAYGILNVFRPLVYPSHLFLWWFISCGKYTEVRRQGGICCYFFIHCYPIFLILACLSWDIWR